VIVLALVAGLGATEASGLTGISRLLATVHRGKDAAQKPPAIGSIFEPLGPVPVTCRDPVAPWPSSAASSASYSPDGTELAVGSADGFVTLWDVDENRTRAICVGHEGTVRALAFHPNGDRMVSAGFDGTLRFWNTATGAKDGKPILLDGRSSNCVAVSPDGAALASSTGPRSDDPGWGGPSPGLLQVWDWTTRQERFALKGHRYRIVGVSFSPDGKTLASAGGHFSDGAEVKVWDLASGREQHSLSGHQWWVECVAFSPDSRFLVSAGGFEKNPGEVRICALASHESSAND